MKSLTAASLMIIAGSIIFLIASFSPTSRVYGEPLPEGRLAIINESRNAWTITQILFSVGAVAVAAGVSAAAFSLRPRQTHFLPIASVLSLAAGALLLTWYAYFKFADPQTWVHHHISNPIFLGYTFLTQAGLFLFGIALLRGGNLRRTSWFLLSAVAITFILTLIFRDMPPFVYYLMTLPVGIGLYRKELSSQKELSRALQA